MKKYKIIYADPPWAYRDKRKKGKNNSLAGGAAHHYNTLKTEEIIAFPIKKISDDDCILFMWATFPNIKEAFKVIDGWGFVYKTLGFSWIKTNKNNNKPCFGIGHYTRSNCEVCLIATKGKIEVKSNKISSVIISQREQHSKKPAIVRDKIIELVGDLPRIELFARQKIDGWDYFGDDISLKNT